MTRRYEERDTIVSGRDLAQIDVMDTRSYVDGPRHDVFVRTRADAPVRWNPSPDGTGFWSITRRADIAFVSSHSELFSSLAAGVFLHKDQPVPLEIKRGNLLYMDPPQHTKYRKILHKAFTARPARTLAGLVHTRVTALLDDAMEAGRCDSVSHVAVPLPLGVLTALMGFGR